MTSTFSNRAVGPLASLEHNKQHSAEKRSGKSDVVEQLKRQVSTLQQELSESRREITMLQEKLLNSEDLKKKITQLQNENNSLRQEVRRISQQQATKEQKKETSEIANQSTLEQLSLLKRESSLKEFEIRDLRQSQNATLKQQIAYHFSQQTQMKYKPIESRSSDKGSSYAASIASNVSTISLLRKKYARSSTFQAKSGMELPIKLFDCQSDDDKSKVEIDVVKIPATQEVRMRVRSSARQEDLDIRDVYANVVDEKVFHLETFDHGYYLTSAQHHIPVTEIVADIVAFQSSGRLPARKGLR